MKISLHFDSHSEARLRELQVQTPSVFKLEANLPLPTFKLSSPSGLFSSNVRLQDLR